ncbi:MULTISPECIES: recombinase family protein [Microbacterium]|uniref:recombinase family protein n=1 Tax=Microbacterium TaxID=33882 RepID=UPI000D647E3D|nr:MULTISPECIES: recombinase family protein [Microbacterium]
MSPVKGRRIIAYLRVSTDRQDLSMDAQRDLIERWAAYRECQIVAWITDPDVSGRTCIAEREGGAKMLAMLTAKEADGIVVTKLDRLSRDVADFAATLKQFREKGWTIAALDFDIDTATTNGEMFANMLINLSQWERRTISDRTKAALAELKRQGKSVGRPALVPLDAPEVQYIDRARRRGETVSQIAAELNALGFTPPRGKQFYPASVQKLIQRLDKAESALAEAS